MDTKNRIQQLIDSISNNPAYSGCVFEDASIFFVIANGKLLEISSDASSGPRGGWFPEILTGPKPEEAEALQSLMNELEFDTDFFEEFFSYGEEFSDEGVLEFFEDNEDKDSLKIYRKIKKAINSGKTPFDSIDSFVDALMKYELHSDRLYYEWEGVYIDFFENILDTGEPIGTYDDLEDDEWIEILESIDDHIVRVD